MGKIVAIGGGEIKDLETLAIDQEVVNLTDRDNPRALFIPTASGDAEGYWETFQEIYGGKLNCKTDVLYLIGLPVAVIIAGLSFAISEESVKETNYVRDNNWPFIYRGLFVGPVEEILYRGFVQGTLGTILTGHLYFFSYATISASIIFVLIHLENVVNGTETWKSFLRQVPVRLISALVLGYSFQVSKSLIYPIIIHNLIDVFDLGVLYYRKKQLTSN